MTWFLRLFRAYRNLELKAIRASSMEARLEHLERKYLIRKAEVKAGQKREEVLREKLSSAIAEKDHLSFKLKELESAQTAKRGTIKMTNWADAQRFITHQEN